MQKNLNCDKLLDISRRMSKSGYGTLLCHNRMMLGCYNVSFDSDIGMHYICHIPDEYEDLYDGHFIWDNQKFLSEYARSRKVADEFRKKEGLPPKSMTNSASYVINDDLVVIDASVQVREMIQPDPTKKKIIPGDNVLMDIGFTLECPTFSSADSNDDVENVLTTFNNLQDRMLDKTVIVDGIDNGILDKIQEFPRVFYYNVELDGDKIRVPLLKSFFRGMTKFDRMMFGVTKTKLDNIAVYTMTFESKGLTDQYIAYIQNFK